MRSLGAAAVVMMVLGCTPEDFPTESLVDRLRLLGISAAPADLAPGESARLSSLVLDPKTPRTTTFWLGCDPDPFNLNRTVCSDPAVISDPSRLGDMASLPPGVRFIGLNEMATYTAPRGLFDVLAVDDPQRKLGTTGNVLAISISQDVPLTASTEELRQVFAKVQSREIASLISLFRLRISEDPERNRNPAASVLTVAGSPWPQGARVMMNPAEQLELDLEAPDDAFEAYVSQTPSGSEPKTERILVAWYSTAGRFSETRTALREQVKTTLTAPGAKPFDPVPPRRSGTLWTVLRDTRGGLSWSEFPFFVCDASLPAPVIRSVRAPSDRSMPVTVEGENLSTILDVVVGGVALRRGRASPDETEWTGDVSDQVPSGERSVVVHTRRCERLEQTPIFIRER